MRPAEPQSNANAPVPGRRSRWWGKALLSVGSVLATLLVLELLFRVLHIAPPELAKIKGPAPGPTNSLGFRDREYSPEKPPGVDRMLCLGDSFTYGAGVAWQETYPKVVEQRLAECYPERTIEVWNCGQVGWNTIEEVRLLRERGLGFDPDIVLIGFFLNDATNLNMNPVLHRIAKRSLRKDWLARHSAFYYYCRWRWQRARLTRSTTRHYLDAFLSQDASRTFWKECQQALSEAKALSQEEDFHLALVLFPAFIDLNEKYPFQPIHEEVKRACAGLQIPFLDLFEIYEGRDANTLRVAERDGHPNTEGHRLAAGAIVQFLEEQRWLQAPSEASPGEP